jgi:hypothetical protein
MVEAPCLGGAATAALLFMVDSTPCLGAAVAGGEDDSPAPS